MRNAAKFEEQILSLASLLEKLLKVIQHSDPSAQEMKKQLYIKYRAKVEELTRETKIKVDWDELKTFVLSLPRNPKLSVSPDSRGVILKKMIRDLEEQYYSKLEVEELVPEPPPPSQPRPKRPLPKKPAPQKPLPADPIAADSLRHTQALAGKSALKSLVDAINKIGPENLESKINQAAKGKKR